MACCRPATEGSLDPYTSAAVQIGIPSNVEHRSHEPSDQLQFYIITVSPSSAVPNGAGQPTNVGVSNRNGPHVPEAVVKGRAAEVKGISPEPEIESADSAIPASQGEGQEAGSLDGAVASPSERKTVCCVVS